MKEEFLFRRRNNGGATSLEVFNIINHIVEGNGLCSDGAQSVSGRNAGLQAC
jgi:hypothetical protein